MKAGGRWRRGGHIYPGMAPDWMLADVASSIETKAELANDVPKIGRADRSEGHNARFQIDKGPRISLITGEVR